MLEISSALSGIIDGKEKIPIGMVWVYDTTNTYPSSGIYVKYYSGVDTSKSSALKRTQFEPNIFNDWSNGIPVELSDYLGYRIVDSGVTVSDPFSIIYTGYFYSRVSGKYEFITKSNGGVELFINNKQLLSGSELGPNSTLMYSSGMWPNKSEFWGGIDYLDTGWHDFRLNFYWDPVSYGSNFTGPYLSATYTDPYQKENTISASAISPYKSFITPTVYTKLIQLNESKDEQLAGTSLFEVSIAKSGTNVWNNTSEDFGVFKLNRLVKTFVGYVTESGYNLTSGYTTNLDIQTDMLQKFTGFIDQVDIAQGKESATITVSCRDFFKKLKNALNENYPNRVDYSRRVLSGVDSRGTFSINRLMPKAYDNWLIYDVIETVALNAGIDPIYINRDNWDNRNYFKLESNLNWPQSSYTDAYGIETPDGDPYLFQTTYGENLEDGIRKFANLIGYNINFNEAGFLEFKEPRATNRVEIYETGTYGSKSVVYNGNWNIDLNLNASNRLQIAPSGNGMGSIYADIYFSGTGFGIYHTTHPAGANYNVQIIRVSDGFPIYNGFISNISATTKYGVLKEVSSTLRKDYYKTRIFPQNTGVLLEGFEYYTRNAFAPVRILRDDTDIISIDESIDDYSLRNEVITVGQQIADKQYLYSKAIDIDSISNPAAYNYVGEKRTTVIMEPTIQSQRRLDWLSHVILDKYKRKSNTISVTCQGLPHIEVGDPVGIYSSKLNQNSFQAQNFYTKNTPGIYFVTRADSKMLEGRYTTVLTLTSLKPIESWRGPLSVTNDILQLIFNRNNNTIFDNFRQLTVNSPVAYGYDGFSNQASFLSFDLYLDVDRLWVLVADTLDGGATFKAINIKDKTPLLQYYVEPNDPRYMIVSESDGNTALPQDAVWLHNGGGERWGNVTVPTANTTFNGGQWIGQNSLGQVRLDGKYPIAIWAQFRTADNSLYYQGIWSPASGQIDERNVTQAWNAVSNGNTFYQFSYNTIVANQGAAIVAPWALGTSMARMPSFVVSNSELSVDMWIGPVSSGLKIIEGNRLLDMSSHFDAMGNIYNYALPTGNHLVAQSKYQGMLTGITKHTVTSTGYHEMYGDYAVGGKKPKIYKLAEGQDWPWRVGDTVLFSGEEPGIGASKVFMEEFWGWDSLRSGNYELRRPELVLGYGNAYPELFGHTPSNRTYFDGQYLLSQPSGEYEMSGTYFKKIFGFTPMGIWKQKSVDPPSPYVNADGIYYWYDGTNGVGLSAVRKVTTSNGIENWNGYSAPRSYGLPSGYFAWSPFSDMNYYIIRPNRPVKMNIVGHMFFLNTHGSGVRREFSMFTSPPTRGTQFGSPEPIPFSRTDSMGGSLTTFPDDNSRISSPLGVSSLPVFKNDMAFSFGNILERAINGVPMINRFLYNNGFPKDLRNPGANLSIFTVTPSANFDLGALEWISPGDLDYQGTNYNGYISTVNGIQSQDTNGEGAGAFLRIYIKFTEAESGKHYYIPMNMNFGWGMTYSNPYAFYNIIP